MIRCTPAVLSFKRSILLSSTGIVGRHVADMDAGKRCTRFQKRIRARTIPGYGRDRLLRTGDNFVGKHGMSHDLSAGYISLHLSFANLLQSHQVLFQCTKRYSPIVQAWSSELTVCSESILQSTLDTLKDHLVRSRAWFAKEENESFDPDFEVGHIPAL